MEHSFILSKMIPGDALSNLNERLHSFCDAHKIKLLCECREENPSLSNPSKMLEVQRIYTRARRKKQRCSIIREENVLQYYPSLVAVPHTRVSNKTVIKFEGSIETPNSLNLFQYEWERGMPIVVSDVKTNSKIWSPEYFLQNFGKLKHSLINCKADTTIKSVPLKYFWKGFESYACRLPRESENDKLILKLKDWPDTHDFADALTEHYQDIMKNIPFPKYTRREGILNLSKYQHPHFLKPDLGPKMYVAYGNFDQSEKGIEKGSTNLHQDISDAVNILVHVSRPEDYKNFPQAQKQYDKNEIRKSLALAGCNEEDLQTFMTSKKLPGAIWHIFHMKDVEKIQNTIRDYAFKNAIPLKRNENPIHNQDWYVDAKLKAEFEKKGIFPYTIIQYEGDCIFIPAKTPHQVTNIFDCIKVALDFVSPENITECFNLTNEFRKLSTRHSNREDKLQIKSILYHTVKNLIVP